MEKHISQTLVVTIFAVIAVIGGPAIGAGSLVNSHNKLVVLEDRGGKSVKQYLPKGDGAAEKRIEEQFRKRKDKKYVNAHFPVNTSLMTVGQVTESEAKDIPYQMATRPIFIIGYDSVSIAWLKKNKQLLTDKKAIGLVVSVKNGDQMKKLQEIVGNKVLLNPTPGDRIAEHLDIHHYPFYMDSDGVLR